MRIDNTDERFEGLKKADTVVYKEDGSKGTVVGFTVYGCLIDWGFELHGENSRRKSTEKSQDITWQINQQKKD